MRCTCEQAAREARKAALGEAAVIAETPDLIVGTLWRRGSERIAYLIRALANTPEKADG